jgi:hypothetical protein
MLKKILTLAPFLILAVLFTSREIKTQTPLTTTPDQKIIVAFQDFKIFAEKKPTVAAETLCQGGFINPTRPELKKVTDEIIQNRVGMKTQDEAGITCLSAAHNWVLFSALNDNEYYCIDSTGVAGKFGVDRKNMKCEN